MLTLQPLKSTLTTPSPHITHSFTVFTLLLHIQHLKYNTQVNLQPKHQVFSKYQA